MFIFPASAIIANQISADQMAASQCQLAQNQANPDAWNVINPTIRGPSICNPPVSEIETLRKKIVAAESHCGDDKDKQSAIKRMKSIVHLLEIKQSEFDELEREVLGKKKGSN